MANVTKPVFKDRYDNFIEVNLLSKGQYFDNPSPVDGKVLPSCSFHPRRH
jgi:aldehyde dehydrogenase (NAD+)/aldehyde dehydrogenase